MIRHRHLRTICASAALSVGMGLFLAAPPATADDDGNLTGGDVNYDGDTVPADVKTQERAKARVAAAFRAARDGKSGAAVELDTALASYEATYGSLGEATDPAPLEMVTTVSLSEKRYLAVDHYAQINSYFCGPGTGKMILKFLRTGKSAFNGATQTQGHIGGKAHMKTWENGKTGWASGLFRIGINRWWQGDSVGWYIDKHNPSVSYFKDALALNIQQYSTPFAADTVEFANQAHYNGHPRGQTIGHWIVVHGYKNYGRSTRFADPSTSVWSSPSQKFNYNTRTFVNTFLNNNGITW